MALTVEVDGERHTYNVFDASEDLAAYTTPDGEHWDAFGLGEPANLHNATMALVAEVNPNGYLEDRHLWRRILWLPSLGRAAMLDGGDPVWTDADTEEDGYRRLLTGELCE